MIGLLADPNELELAHEFFQLFKTPWEPCREDRRYDVVVSTDGRLPSKPTRLLLMYGSNVHTHDHDLAIPGERLVSPTADYDGMPLPIYGHALVVEPECPATTVSKAGIHVIAARMPKGELTTVRIGYDLFHEISHLLCHGQPARHAACPTVELHIALLRKEILLAGIPLLEIPPVPAGHPFFACLTHDIDFVGIRNHLFDHTMWGFLYRSTIGALARWLRGTISLARLMDSWFAALKLPLIYLGIARDFWLPFEWYLRVEQGIPTTYFLIPYRNRAGEKVTAENSARRAAKYDVSEIPEWTSAILAAGNEIGVHGIDAWHDADAARDELHQVSRTIFHPVRGIRMHWLLQGEDSYRLLDEAGIDYDSTAGYNDTIGYRCGSAQVFRPPGARRLLELPLHIQDGALFFPDKLGLTEAQAWDECERIIQYSEQLGGIVTVLWHDRSHGPERFWGDFYLRLLDRLRESSACFMSASQVVDWFRRRREVRFGEIESYDGALRTTIEITGPAILPPLRIRVHQPTINVGGSVSLRTNDQVWSGDRRLDFDLSGGCLARSSA